MESGHHISNGYHINPGASIMSNADTEEGTVLWKVHNNRIV